MNGIFKSLLVGLIVGIGTYAIIKASKDNPKVKRIIIIIVLSITTILAVIMIFFLFNVWFNYNKFN